jgi:imidazole glycerol-phosphate synthase subunit HisH
VDVAIIDYQMSNLHSVQAACDKVGLSSTITIDAEQILSARAAILPGVGAFGKAMIHLTESGLDKSITRFVETGKPFIGICLGLQLLFERSEEFGNHQGLGLIKGAVRKFCFNNAVGTKYPVPQVGWNRVQQNGSSWKDSLLCENQSGDFMYFVHSYYVQPDEENVVLARTTYGDQQYCSAIQKENLFATQFHPEKSGGVGMKIYEQLKKQLMDK